MKDDEIIFKPHYSGRAAFSLWFWPISAIGFIYFTYQSISSGAYYSLGLLALMFAVAAFSPPFMYFRALVFGENLVVKRYLLPDVVIAYNEITSFQYFSLRTAKSRVALNNLNPKSFAELDQIVERMIKAGKIKLKPRR